MTRTWVHVAPDVLEWVAITAWTFLTRGSGPLESANEGSMARAGAQGCKKSPPALHAILISEALEYLTT